MLASMERRNSATYLNPVYSKSFPDPFVIKFGRHYYAYSTGFADDGAVFSVLRSADLVSWTPIGGAMTPLEPSPPYYWAPEVVYEGGQFYLYYSVGNETLMELRVAVSSRPDGGFVDSGHRLTREEFAIDAHVFIDDDGQHYLFYATDFLEHTHIGTGTVVDRMIDPYTLEGKPVPVTRARYDWQVYDPARREKGGVRWHTVEGPAVLKRKGRYYEMFSGGNWQDTSYGVSFAVADSVRSDREWTQFSDGQDVLPILRTLPGSVVGPGHNSVVRGPNNRELYCVYHRWVDDHRVMAIDRMDFAGERIFVVGPSFTPQPKPLQPGRREEFRSTVIPSGMDATGEWDATDDGLVSGPTGRNEIAFGGLPQSCLCELEIAAVGNMDGESVWGLSLKTESGSELDLHFAATSAFLAIDGVKDIVLPAADHSSPAPHFLRVDLDHRRVSIRVDDVAVITNVMLDSAVSRIAIVSENQSVRLGLFEQTEGFEELFETTGPLEDNGWVVAGDVDYRIEGGELIVGPAAKWSVSKGEPSAGVELTANFRLLREHSSGSFGIRLTAGDWKVFDLAVDLNALALSANGLSVPLPLRTSLARYHQLRVIKRDSTAIAYFDDVCLGEFSIDAAPVTGSVFSDQAPIAIEMIRQTSF
jgi:GH43 family beta-xylosidase